MECHGHPPAPAIPPLGGAVPTSPSKPWASFPRSLSIPPPLLLPGCQGKAHPTRCRLVPQIILAMAGVVHTIRPEKA